MSNLHTNFRLETQAYIGGNWFTHGPKHHKEKKFYHDNLSISVIFLSLLASICDMAPALVYVAIP